MTTTAMTAPKSSALMVMASKYNMEPDKMLATLRGTVIKKPKEGSEATNEEVAAFVIVANEYGLNPFLKELYAFPDRKRGGVVPIVSIDGWARIINNQPAYNGVEFADVTDEKGNLVAMTCRLHVKGRDYPAEVTEYLDECRRNTEPWNQMPHRMLRHKALIQCARYAFSLSGIYDEDEGRDIVERNIDDKPALQRPQPLSARQVVATVAPVQQQAPPADDPFTNAPDEPPGAPRATKEPERRLGPHDTVIDALAQRLSVSGPQAMAILERKCKPLLSKGQKSLKDLKQEQLDTLMGLVNAGHCDPEMSDAAE